MREEVCFCFGDNAKTLRAGDAWKCQKSHFFHRKFLWQFFDTFWPWKRKRKNLELFLIFHCHCLTWRSFQSSTGSASSRVNNISINTSRARCLSIVLDGFIRANCAIFRITLFSECYVTLNSLKTESSPILNCFRSREKSYRRAITALPLSAMYFFCYQNRLRNREKKSSPIVPLDGYAKHIQKRSPSQLSDSLPNWQFPLKSFHMKNVNLVWRLDSREIFTINVCGSFNYSRVSRWN